MYCNLIYLLPDLTVNLCVFFFWCQTLRHLPNTADWSLISVSVRIAFTSNILISSTFAFYVWYFFSSAYKKSCRNRSTVLCLYAHSCINIRGKWWYSLLHLIITQSVSDKHVGRGQAALCQHVMHIQSYQSVCLSVWCSISQLSYLSLTRKGYQIAHHMSLSFLSQALFCLKSLLNVHVMLNNDVRSSTSF